MTCTPLPLPLYVRLQRTAITTFVLALIAWGVLPESFSGSLQPTASAASLTVNSLNDTPDAIPGNGTCADVGGLCTLRAALQEANALSGNHTINFSVTGTINLTSALPSIISHVAITGPGSALLTVRRDTGGNYRIFFIIPGRIVTISGLTVTNGRTVDGLAGGGFAPGYGGSGENGGGIFNSGTLTLTDVVVTGNRTGDGGAGTSGTGGFGGYGAGIFSSGPLTMTRVTVSNNIAGNGAVGFFGGEGGKGGGIYFTGTALTMTECSVLGNTAGNGVAGTSGGSSGSGGDGGGINAQVGTVTFMNVTIDGNHAGDGAVPISSSGGSGGGLFTWPGVQTTITNGKVSNNNAGQGGNGFSSQGGAGGGIDNLGPMTIVGSTINGNFTKGPSAGGGGRGGGIFNSNLLTIINSTISGNATHADVGRGGGIYNNGATVSLINSTITGNSALTCCGFENGAGIHNGGTANVRNSIIAGNGNGSVPDVTGDFNSQGHNLIGRATLGPNHGSSGDQTGFVHGNNGDQVGTIAAPVDALLGPLTNNGGPTFTHALLTNSPALDAADNCVAEAAHCGDANIPQLISDQRGAGRLADSPDADSTATVDIGAFEFHASLEDVPDKTINEDIVLVFGFSAGDTGATVNSVSASSSNQSLIPDANIVITGSGTVRTATITPTANQSGTALITLTVIYSGGASLNDTFTLTVNSSNDPPAFTKGADPTVLEDAGAQTITNWATAISAGPSNESGQTLNFNVTGNTNAALFSAGPTISDTGTLTFTPLANAYGSAVITVVLQDNGGTANGGVNTSASQQFTITVTPVNDPPVFTKGPDVTVDEDSSQQFIANWATGISPGPNESIQTVFFEVTSDNPNLFFGTPSVTTNGGLIFSPRTNTAGTATVTVVANDFGGTQNGGQQTSAPQTFTITVNPINDAPLLFMQATQTASQNTPRIFSAFNGNAIAISDVDAGTNPVRLSLTATQGTITLSSTTGLTFLTGDGTDDSSMSFTGTVVAINACLEGASFQPTQGFTGQATIQGTVDDQGFTGAGGAKSESKTCNITVQPGGNIQFSAATYSVNENSGTATITLSRVSGSSGTATVLFQTSNGTAGAGDYNSVSQTVSFANGQTSRTVLVGIINDSTQEPNETINLTISDAGGSGSLGTPATAVLTIQDNDAPVFSFAFASYSVSESGPSITIAVNRAGDPSVTASVDFSTNDFIATRCDTVPAQASAKCDYATAGGLLRFAPGEVSKTIVLSLVDDAFVEGGEQLSVALSNPVNAAVGSPSTTVVTILDNDTDTGPNVPNPFLNNAFFVRQQYLDFLLREPDTQGFNDWNAVLNNCQPNGGFLGSPPGCDRIHVSSGFFRSTEFGEKGYWVYRFYESALGRRPQFAEFMPEMRRLSGLMPDAEQEARRADFISRFMQLPEFTANFNGLTDAAHATQFIEKLEQVGRVTLPASTTTEPGQPPQYGRQQLINLMSGGQLTAAQTLRAFIEQKVVWDTYFYRAFVAMQYFGYLRRDPEPAGYDDWVRVLTLGDAPTGIQPGDYRHLIFGFVYSVEYRERFGLP